MPSKTPAVSIVIPVYNADPTYLQQCLESVQAQDCNNVEVIVVDDGSTDTGTVRMCESFSNVFTVLHQSNQGVAAARNNGIAHASGEWVAFIDADDWIAPTFLSRLAELGRRSDADIVICDCMVERGSHSAMNHFSPSIVLSHGMMRRACALCCRFSGKTNITIRRTSPLEYLGRNCTEHNFSAITTCTSLWA
ncbi:glycosyltransferase family 2 protein [Bifidobacterium canis]|uniref:Glycosyltransferase, group 2 family protein n=1 Tax=Bifidobacterium canis TaxID=2610880 RepID=A0A7K1J5F3_9BIFI|nr:glycosyltransferase family A protein [Bifidobacterium canis]MUH59884.1 glycosyltransferase, group 2 family protein [Bifidobacterium canis]